MVQRWQLAQQYSLTPTKPTCIVAGDYNNSSQNFSCQMNEMKEIKATLCSSSASAVIQESCAVAKMTARCALYMGALNFLDSLTTPTATIHNIFHGLLFRSTLWMFLQNLKSVALPITHSWDNIGVPKKFGQSLDTPTLPFPQNFNGDLFGLAL